MFFGGPDMKLSLFAAVVGCAAGMGQALAQPPGTPLPEGIRGGSEVVPESGVEVRHYRFEETGEDLPYSVFVSSKVKADTPAPLIIALRGYTGTTLTFVRGTAVDLAEKGGYILVGPIGYNNRAGFGVPARTRPPGGPAPAPPAAGPPFIGGTAATDPATVTAYSEKDVMNVLAMVRDEFNVDADRIYLMGHSQGGGGARHLAEKYPDVWAAVALIAPAIFGAELTAESNLIDMPVMVAIGDQDFLLDGVRAFGEQLAALDADAEYEEFPGLDHGTIILGSMPVVYRFFADH
jgi:pimeloyl-ACP methyl ester carboxylesterase